MGWYNSGFDSTNNAYDYDDKDKGPRRFWMPPEAEKRIIFLDENPQTYWEHVFKHRGSWKNYEPCKIRNRMDNDCAVCERYPESFPAFIGMFSIINLSIWENNKGMQFCYGRELFVAKLGGKEKPGVLKKMERLKKQNNGLTGCIFDVYRSGKKTESVGDEFTLIEKIEPRKLVEHGKGLIKEWVKKINENISDPEKHYTLEKFWERNPWVPFNYEEILTFRSNEQLKEMFKLSGKDESSKEKDDSSNDNALDDSAPY